MHNCATLRHYGYAIVFSLRFHGFAAQVQSPEDEQAQEVKIDFKITNKASGTSQRHLKAFTAATHSGRPNSAYM